MYATQKKRAHVSFKKELKGVVDKRIVKEICSFIEDAVNDLGVDWSSDSHRLAVAQITEDCLAEMEHTKHIEQYKIICDRRNNKAALMEQGIFRFDVAFRQKNCLNNTQILYTITVEPSIGTQLSPDWSI